MIPAEEGYTLTLQYPFYDVAIIQPYDSYQMMYAYPVAKDSSESYLLALDYWIRMEKDYGMLDAKYDYWVLGEVPAATGPRWSVVRNVAALGSVSVSALPRFSFTPSQTVLPCWDEPVKKAGRSGFTAAGSAGWSAACSKDHAARSE